MMALFFKECRQVLRSLVYYIYIIVFVLFITQQMGAAESGALQEPQPGQDYYGYGYTSEPQAVMEQTIEELFLETYRNDYSTYPFGFIKVVTLNDGELAAMKAELETATGKPFEELCDIYVDYWQDAGESMTYEEHMKKESDWHIPLRQGYTYAEFEEQMSRVTGVIGKGCTYDDGYQSGAMCAMSYEDARKEYENLCKKDRVTGAAMRLFCDYAGIVLSVLPIFVAVSTCLRDRRAKASEVICAKQISGSALMLSRYLANVILMFVPVVACAFLLQMPYVYQASEMGLDADPLACVTYSVVWLLPLILTTTSVAFVLTELTDSILAILVQSVWGYLSLMSTETIVGNFGWKLVPRWNEFGSYERFASELPQLLRNRGYYAVLALALFILSIAAFERKRKRGGMARGNIRKTRG